MKESKKKAVVFGGSGFLGSHVADVLFSRGYQVLIYDCTASRYLHTGQKEIIGDIRDADAVENAVKDAYIVYDFAGIANLDDASTKPIETIELNVKATCIIMEACIKHGVNRFIYASSFYVHSEKGGFYRCSKQAAELYIEEYSRKYGLDFTILRYGSLYGPRVTGRNGVNELLKGALKGAIEYNGSGEEIREYIHVVDAAELSVEILDKEYVNKYIVLTGHEGIRVRDMVEMIQEIIGKPIEVKYKNQKSDLHYHMTPYNFKPKYSYKMTSNCYRDIGEGLVECLNEISGADGL